MVSPVDCEIRDLGRSCATTKRGQPVSPLTQRKQCSDCTLAVLTTPYHAPE